MAVKAVKTFLKKEPVQAIQFTDDMLVIASIVEWAAEFGVELELKTKFDIHNNRIQVVGLRIPTLEGEMVAPLGSYIAKGVKNEFWFIKEDIFKKTYEEI